MKLVRSGLVLIAIAGTVAGCGSSSTAIPSRLSIRIQLDHTEVMAGHPIDGVAVVSNETNKAITVDGCPGQWLMVGLANGQVSYDPGVGAQACMPSVHLLPGRTSFQVTVYSTYGRCSMTGPFTPSLPHCSKSGPPPLPPGHYGTSVVTNGLPSGVQVVPSVEVTLKRQTD